MYNIHIMCIGTIPYCAIPKQCQKVLVITPEAQGHWYYTQCYIIMQHVHIMTPRHETHEDKKTKRSTRLTEHHLLFCLGVTTDHSMWQDCCVCRSIYIFLIQIYSDYTHIAYYNSTFFYTFSFPKLRRWHPYKWFLSEVRWMLWKSFSSVLAEGWIKINTSAEEKVIRTP